MKSTPTFACIFLGAVSCLLSNCVASQIAVKTGEDSGTYTDPVTGIAFVAVEGGCYEMGCGSWAGDCEHDEKPLHEVCVDSFLIGKYEITQSEWQQVMGHNPSKFQKGNNYPVEQVSWIDTREFIRKINTQSDRSYRLPTEAEWEYACRSGGKKEMYCGGNNVDAVAWYISNSGGATHPVGTKSPNALGIHDMSGNVWEWVEDWYDGNYYRNSPRNNPRGPSSGLERTIHGGSWNYYPMGVRAAHRHGFKPDNRSTGLGFRLVSPGL